MSRNNERFEHVRANVGTMFDDGGMEAYFERLARYNVDMKEYLKWSIEQPAAVVEKNEPASVLAKIKGNSLRDLNAVADLGVALANVVGNVIQLAQDQKRRFLVGADSAALSLGRFSPVDNDDNHGPGVSLIPESAAPSHPLILELSTPSSSSGSETSKQPSGAHKLPRYVVSLGRLLIHDLRNIKDIPSDEQPTTEVDPDDRPLQPTNYAVVMDAISTERSIWLVYNRAPLDLEAGCQFASAPTDPDQSILFPPSENFDSAMVMPNAQMWQLGASILSLDSVVEFVAGTKSSGPVLAIAAPEDAVNAAL